MPFDATVNFEDGTSHVYKGIPDGTTPDAVSAQAYQEAGKKVKSMDGGIAPPKPSTLGGLWDGVKAGAAEIPSLAADVGRSTSRMLNDWAAHSPPVMALTGGKGAPIIQQQADKGTNAMLPTPTGDSTARQYVRSGIEGVAPAVLTGGSAAPAAAIKSGLVGLTSGVGGEAADKLTNGAPWARTLGTIITGLIAGTGVNRVGSPKPNQVTLAKEAVEGLSPAALEKASAFQAQSAAKGLNLDLAQALSAIGEPEQNLKTLRDYLANSKAGNTTQKMLREQPSQLSTVADTAIGGLPGKVLDEGAAANNLAQVATKTIDNAKKARSDAVRADYAKAGDLSEGMRATLIQQVTDSISKPGVTDSVKAAGQELIRKFTAPAVGDVAKAERLKSALTLMERSDSTPQIVTSTKPLHALDADTALGEAVGAFKGSPLSPPDPRSAGQMKGIAGQVNQTLKDGSEAIKAAEGKFAQISTDVVNPLKQGPVGQMAGRRGYLSDVQSPATRIASWLAKGSDPQATTPSALTTLGEELNKTDPTAFANAAKTYYSGKVAESFKPTFGAGEAANADAAGKLVTNLFNDTKQWQGMKDTATVVAKGAGLDPAEVIKGLENFGQMVKGAANRPGTVSGLNPADIVKIGSNSNLATVGKSFGLSPTKPFAIKLEDATLQKTLSQFDRILTTPEGASLLAELAKTGVMSPEAKSLLQAFSASEGTRKPR